MIVDTHGRYRDDYMFYRFLPFVATSEDIVWRLDFNEERQVWRVVEEVAIQCVPLPKKKMLKEIL